MRSGWCSAAPGARVPHKGCRMDGCGCECHEKSPKVRGSERETDAPMWDNESAPDRCANTTSGADHLSFAINERG